MGSSRTIEIEIPRVQVVVESYKLWQNGMDVVVNFISEGASNKRQLWIINVS